MKIRPNCAARTLESDIRPIVEISQRVGIAIEAATFLGSSPRGRTYRGVGARNRFEPHEDSAELRGAHTGKRYSSHRRNFTACGNCDRSRYFFRVEPDPQTG